MGVGKVTLLFLATFVCCKAADLKWWQTASFYQIYPRSFKDSDGDGVGDLKGITQQLHYLKEIGVTATWLSPIMVSPMAEFGYDVANLTAIDPLFGTMDDLEALMAKGKQLRVKIIMDFVPNHTSDECEWFKKSVANDSFYKDFYVWHPGKIVDGVRQPPTTWISNFRKSMWTFNDERGEYYLHQFLIKQPDLNYRNPKVVDAIKDVLRFWLRKGAAGFRVDAILFAFEIAPDSEGNYPDEPRNFDNNDPEDYNYYQHIYTKDQPETIDLVYQFRDVLDEMKAELKQKDDFIMMTEAYTDLEHIMEYYGNATHEGAQIPFNFDLLTKTTKESTALDYDRLINVWLSTMPEGKTANWVMGNHDQPRIASRLGEDKIDIINMMLMTLPGCSVTYQGEELGMTDVWISWRDTKDPRACQTNPQEYESVSRDPNRTPFQWNDQPFAGFTNGSSSWLPVSENYHVINAERERNTSLSHLNVYKKVKSLRRNPVFQRGSAVVKALNERVLAIKRFLPSYDSFFVLLNLGNGVEMIDLNKHFENVTSKLQYVVTTGVSNKRPTQVIKSWFVILKPKDAVILKTL